MAESDARWSKHLRAEIIDELLNGATTEHAQQAVRSRYETWRSRTVGRPLRELIETFLDAVAKRYDAQSAFFGGDTFAQFGIHPHEVGIGALLTENRGRIYVQEVQRRGPSDKPGGLAAGDLILKIQDRDAARGSADYLRSCGEKSLSLELATRRRQMEDEQAMATGARTYSANSPGQMPSRLVFLDAKTAEPKNERGVTAAADPAQIDPLLTEAVRIVRDAVEAKWTPDLN